MKYNIGFIRASLSEDIDYKEKDVEIGSLSEYMEEVSKIKETKRGTLIYRGQPDISYQLIPKIGRMKEVVNNPSLEHTLFLEFKMKYQMYYDKILERDMDILMLAQHYGLPTRLLDWTKDFLVALYFACLKEENKDGVVFIRTLNNLNAYEDIKTEEDPFQYEENFIIMPEIFETRFNKQKGLFEYFGNPFKEVSRKQINKIKIKADSKKRILKELESASHGVLDLFPTLDNLCISICKEFL